MMIRQVFVLGAFSLMTLGATQVLAAPATWEIDPSHSSAQFSVRHMAVSNVRGELGKVTGTVTVDDQNITKSMVEATIDATGIDTRDAKRDEHLKGPDFLDTTKNPNITFKSTSVKKAGPGKLKVTGLLTIRGITKETTLDVVGPSKPIQDPWGNQRSGASATTKLKRQDFGITWNLPLGAGSLTVGDDVNVTLELEFVQKPAAGAAAPTPSAPTPPAAPAKAAPAKKN